jgi:dolichol kinase
MVPLLLHHPLARDDRAEGPREAISMIWMFWPLLLAFVRGAALIAIAVFVVAFASMLL